MVHLPQRQGLGVLTLFATAPLLGLVAAHPEELTQERVQNIAIIGKQVPYYRFIQTSFFHLPEDSCDPVNF